MSGAATPTAPEPPALDDRDMEPRTPMKRLGSTRKLAAFSNIRIQLTEQTRVLDQRAEAAAGVAGELSDYCRRRADLEHEYSRALDKLARAAHQRHKEQKHKREQWALTGAFACWQAALENTKALSRDHAALAELYAGPLAARLQRAADDALRLNRKCRDIVAERHEEVGAALAEAGAAGKAHAAASADWRAAALKLRHAAEQRARLAAASPPRHKKLKALDKELDKRRARYSEARAKALRARADYALSLEAANATLQRYYLDDIADIMLCTEVGFEAVVGRAVRTSAAAETARAHAAAAAAHALLAAADALDALADRQRALDAHAQAFALPRPLPHQDAPPHKQVPPHAQAPPRRARRARRPTQAFALPRPLPHQDAPPHKQVPPHAQAPPRRARRARRPTQAFALPRPLPHQDAPPHKQVPPHAQAPPRRARRARRPTQAFALPRPLPHQDAPPHKQVPPHAQAPPRRARRARRPTQAFALPRPLPHQDAPPHKQVPPHAQAPPRRARRARRPTQAFALPRPLPHQDAPPHKQVPPHAQAPPRRARRARRPTQAFALPRPLPHQGAPPHKPDAEMSSLVEGAIEDEDEATRAVAAELQHRLQQLEAGARQLRAECRESAKTLDAAEAELIKQMEGSDASWDVSALFGPGAAGGGALAAGADDDAPRRDQEDYYLAKFRAYVSCAGRLARLESKAAAARARLGGAGPGGPRPPSPPSPPRRAAARLRRGRFAAPLDTRLPLVLTSCVRVIATYGLRHQGVFRVSGSQVEMQALRAAFERGEDPLARVCDASDINSVCGLLKMYLREVRPPLLPPQLQEVLLRVAAIPDDAEFVRRLRDTLAALPQPAVLVLRYLFAFLQHLTEYSEYNMMDAWNLAICLGPTLLAAWGEGGAQVAAQNLLNELVKRTIVHHAEIFPQHVHPHALYVRGSSVEELEPAADETDARDDLSLYDEDEDELSEDGESGEWPDSNSTGTNYRSASVERRSSAAQVAPAPPPRSAPAEPAASTSATQCRRLAESTPDLVLDLPARPSPAATPTPGDAPPTPAPDPAPAPSPAPDDDAQAMPATEPTPDAAADAADTFLHNRDTLKKRPNSKRSEGPEIEAAAEPEPAVADTEPVDGAAASGGEGSPVPARNTARVAAKFADLTLTGGSLKPALAAKPALLRRPTPHPHPRPAPPLAPAAPPRADPDPAC